MYINRITFSIDKDKTNENDWNKFNRITNYYEELVQYFLPRKVKFGGFGFFNNKIQTEINPLHIKTYGKCIDYFHLVDHNDLKIFFELKPNKQLDILNELLKTSVLNISNEHEIDTDILINVIEKTPAAYDGFEQKLKVSKSHKSRKIKVDIIRAVNLENENIKCRIANNSNSIIEDWILEENTSVYNSSFSYRKSKWNENSLEIYDRFGKVYKTVDVTKYIGNST
jgi:predicted DNA-binding protein YlxM (UPF0122 family)